MNAIMMKMASMVHVPKKEKKKMGGLSKAMLAGAAVGTATVGAIKLKKMNDQKKSEAGGDKS